MMNEMKNAMKNEWLPLIAISIGGLLLLLFIIIFFQGLQIRKLRRKYETIMGGSGVECLDSLLPKIHQDIVQLQDMTAQNHREIKQVKLAMKKMKSHVGIQRYNAFAERGSDLSFSIAWLNEEEDGVVITNIHGRDHSYIYAKPIEKGQSFYSLSPEEKRVIELTKTR